MEHVVTLHPSGVQFANSGDESVLASALKHAIVLEHSCGTGQCGACKAKVLAGEVDFVDAYSVLTENEKAENIILTCTSRAKTALQLDAEYYPELANIVKKTVPCKIADMQFPTTDAAILRLRLPPTASFSYLPGQYLDLTAPPVASPAVIRLPVPPSKITNWNCISARWWGGSSVNWCLAASSPSNCFACMAPMVRFSSAMANAP